MARELHHRKKDNKYALWSTVIDDYVTKWEDKQTIKRIWLNEKIQQSKRQVDKWIEEIDKEI